MSNLDGAGRVRCHASKFLHATKKGKEKDWVKKKSGEKKRRRGCRSIMINLEVVEMECIEGSFAVFLMLEGDQMLLTSRCASCYAAGDKERA